MHSLGLLLQDHINSIEEKLVVVEAPDIENLIAIVLTSKDYALFEALCMVVNEVLMPSLVGSTMRLSLNREHHHGLDYLQYSIMFNRHLNFQHFDQQDALVTLARMARYTSCHNTFEVSLDSTDTKLLLMAEVNL